MPPVFINLSIPSITLDFFNSIEKSIDTSFNISEPVQKSL